MLLSRFVSDWLTFITWKWLGCTRLSTSTLMFKLATFANELRVIISPVPLFNLPRRSDRSKTVVDSTSRPCLTSCQIYKMHEIYLLPQRPCTLSVNTYTQWWTTRTITLLGRAVQRLYPPLSLVQGGKRMYFRSCSSVQRLKEILTGVPRIP